MAAEEIIFKVGVDTGNSVNDLNKVEQGLNDIDKSAQSIGTDAASRFEALNKKIESGGLTIKDARKALKEYQDIALQAGRTSPIGQAAIQAAGDLKDTIGDLRTELTNAGTDGANMQAALQLGSGIAAGYGAMQGTMALLGGESDALAQSMQKLMAIQTVLQSIEQIRAILEKESFLMQKARTAATFVQTAATSGLAAATGGATAAMAALNAAMLANPVLLVVAGIAALVGAIVWLVSEEEKAEEMNNRITKSYERMTAAAERSAAKRRQASENAIEIAKLEGASIEEVHALQRQAILDTESERVASISREKNAIHDRRAAYRQALNEGNEDLAKSIKDEISQHRKKYADLTLQNNQYKHDLKVADLTLKKEQQERDDAAEEKARQARKAAADKAKQERDKQAQLRIEQQRMLEDLIVANIEDADQRALAALNLKHQRERDEIVKKYGENAQLIAELEKRQQDEQLKLMDEQEKAYDEKLKQQNEKAAADAKAARDKQFADDKAAAELRLLQAEEDFYAQQEAKKQLALIERDAALANDQLTANERLLIEEQYQQKVQAVDDETTKHNEANAKMLSDAKLKIAQDSLQLIQNITELFGKKNEKAAKIAFNVDKAAKIASATIAGIEGTINAYKTAQGSPITALLPAYPTIQAGLAAAFAATNIAKIARTQFQSSGGGASSQAAVSAPSQGTPAVPLPEGQTTLTAGLPGGGGQQGSKVYVLDSDITAQQTMSSKVQALATFGG